MKTFLKADADADFRARDDLQEALWCAEGLTMSDDRCRGLAITLVTLVAHGANVEYARHVEDYAPGDPEIREFVIMLRDAANKVLRHTA